MKKISIFRGEKNKKLNDLCETANSVQSFLEGGISDKLPNTAETNRNSDDKC